jgi:hypothetical protein
MQPIALKLNHYNMKRSVMKTLLMILVSVLMISVFGCQKEEVSTKSIGTGLVGKWEWVSSSGGISYVHLTPSKLGYPYWIAFTNDSMYQVYARKINVMTSSNRFTVFNAISIFTTHLHQMMKADNMTRSSFEVRNDSLFMSEEVSDGFDMIFIRK